MEVEGVRWDCKPAVRLKQKQAQRSVVTHRELVAQLIATAHYKVLFVST